MILNYLKTALRYVVKNMSFTLINLAGLTAGIAAFILIALYLQDQLQYDSQMASSRRLYRLVGIQEPAGLDKQHVAITSAVWVPWMLENIPVVEDAFRMMYATSDIVAVDDQSFRVREMFFSEGKVIEHKGFPLLSGGNDMLAAPNNAVISREIAERIYGTKHAVGKTFLSGGETYLVNGVFENQTRKTHLKPEIILSFSTIEHSSPWLQMPGNNSVVTYVLLKPGADPASVESMVNDRQRQFENEMSEHQIMRNNFYLQPYSNIFLRSGHIKFHAFTSQGNITNIYILSVVALLILTIASINYINLATANSSKRAREVGLRKVLGAGRNSLAFQFIGESMIITFFALLIALALVEVLLPWYNSLLDTSLLISIYNPLFWLGMPLLLLLLGFVSGFYPAIYLSRYQPGYVLRSGSSSGKPHTAFLRKVLVVVQFAISTALILATLVVMHQVNHMQTRDLGYNRDNVITIYNRQTSDHERIIGFRNQLLNFPEVVSAGIASGYSGIAGRQSTITTADSVPNSLMVRYGYVDPDFFPTMEIDIIEGRNFSSAYGTDPNQTIILNRAAVKALGWGNPIGKRIVNDDDVDYDYYTVIGVIEDYHYFSLHRQIEPAVYIWRPDELSVINVRHNAASSGALMNKIKDAYEQYFPGYYYNSLHLSGIISNLYRQEENIMKIFIWFSFLCIVISSLGLFGLTSFMVNQRRREIGIRRVLGGTLLQINSMLMKGFMKWIFTGALLALPITWVFMERWLQNYPYRIFISAPVLMVTLSIIFLISAITILSISTRAAMQNPAHVIRYE